MMKKLATAIKLLTASTISFGIISSASAAHAFVPQEEGEVGLSNFIDSNNTNGCRSDANCIDTKSLGYTVKGLGKNPSLLFVDDSATFNEYEFGDFSIIFPGLDAKDGDPTSDAQGGTLQGTVADPGQYFFRPVKLKLDSDGKPKPVEGGQREVGRFRFNFTEKIEELKLVFFDVEEKGTSHNSGDGKKPVEPGKNGNIREVTLTNVKSLKLNIGKGQDGALVQVYKVPEPGTVFSFGVLAVAGAFGVSKRKKTAAN